MINENAKKTLKIAGFILLILFLYGVFRLFTGAGNIGGNSLSVSSPEFSGRGSYDMTAGSAVAPMASRDFAGDMTALEESGFASGETAVSDKRVIKNGNLTIKVDSTERSAEHISRIAKEKGGEVFSTNFYERVKGQKSGTITVKVPIEKFEETVEDIKKIATQVVNEYTSALDVTEQYTDLQAQLKNKRAEEESFAKILDQSGKIDDILSVTKEISRVRGEIERLEGRIKYMESQTDMSVISVDISEDVEVAPISQDWRPWQVVKKSFSELIGNIQDFTDATIRFIIVGIPSLIPFALLLLLIYWGGKKIYGKIKA
ncbi:MAG: DUF4349 domain-containing protein [Candidatus Moranbacteria bacterium]|nr:DUF4349 domain-containing protein [Candidatus Moranbacteria bacterium]